ncbi:MAG: GIY-YIG nuclease family protein [Syntrophobacteraceae bacterium]
MKTNTVNMQGYYVSDDAIPSSSGIYCVYAGTFNRAADTVSLRKLLYIGESANVHDRIAGHERKSDWRRYLQSGEILIYSFGAVPASDRNRVEAAMIYKHKPPCNVEYVDSFPFEDTTIYLTGRTELLTTYFVVYNTESRQLGFGHLRR